MPMFKNLDKVHLDETDINAKNWIPIGIFLANLVGQLEKIEMLCYNIDKKLDDMDEFQKFKDERMIRGEDL